MGLLLWILMLVGFGALIEHTEPAPARIEVSLLIMPSGATSAGSGVNHPHPEDRTSKAASTGGRAQEIAAQPPHRSPRKPAQVRRVRPRADRSPHILGKSVAALGQTHSKRPSPAERVQVASGTTGRIPARKPGDRRGAGGAKHGNPMVGDGSGSGAVAAGLVEHPPIVIKRVLPRYPAAERKRGVEGEVLLRAIVDRSGAVQDPVTVKSSAPSFDAAAIAALRKWRFEPGRDRAGRPVPVLIEVPLRFTLRQ